MATSAGPKIPTDDLILYLDAANIKSFPSGEGNVTLFDLSLDDTDAELLVGTDFSDTFNGVVTFDGLSGYISFGKDYLLSNQNATFSVWFRVTDFNTTGSHTPSRITFGYHDANFNRMLAVYEGGYGLESNTNSNPDELSGDTNG